MHVTLLRSTLQSQKHRPICGRFTVIPGTTVERFTHTLTHPHTGRVWQQAGSLCSASCCLGCSGGPLKQNTSAYFSFSSPSVNQHTVLKIQTCNKYRAEPGYWVIGHVKKEKIRWSIFVFFSCTASDVCGSHGIIHLLWSLLDFLTLGSSFEILGYNKYFPGFLTPTTGMTCEHDSVLL